MTDTNKIVLLFLWLIGNLVLLGAGACGAGGEIVALAIGGLVFWVILFFATVGASLQADSRRLSPEKMKQIKEDTEKQRLQDCIKRQKESGLPTQEVLQEIADEFGFTLKGEFRYVDDRWKTEIANSEFTMETHKSFEELKKMGINTFKDIFGDYFLLLDIYGLYAPAEKQINEKTLQEEYEVNYSNVTIRFSYNKKYNVNKDIEWNKDYIIMVLEKNKNYFIYRDSGVIKKSVDELTANEKTFIIEGKRRCKYVIGDDKTKACEIHWNPYYNCLDYCYLVSSNKPLLLK